MFCIVVPTGLGTQLQSNYVFGESDSRSQNEEVVHNDKGDAPDSVSSSSSESSSRQNLVDPFDSSDDENHIKKIKENTILPDVIGTDDHHSSTDTDTQPEDHHSSTDTDTGSMKNSHSQPELQSELGVQSQSKSSSEYVDNNNPDGQKTNELYDENESDTTLGIDAQADTSNNNINNDTTEKVNEKVTVSGDLPNANNNQSGSSTISEPESQSAIQPRYKSYRDYIDNNTKNDNIIQTDDKSVTETDGEPVTEVNSIGSQGGTSDDNVSHTRNAKTNASEYSINPGSADFHTISRNQNVNDKASELISEITNPENQSTIDSNSTTNSQLEVGNRSSNSNSTTNSQTLYKSYRDFIEDNKENKETNNEEVVSRKSTVETNSATTSSSQVTTQSSNKPYGDFNGDGWDDLAIGIPNENNGAGGVEVIYGSSSGLIASFSGTAAHADQFWTQNSADILDASETDDGFGSSLASGDFNDDGWDDLAIGVPGDDTGSATDAGGVNVIYGSGAGLHALLSPNQFWRQSSPDVENSAELNDQFGESLASGDFNGDGKDDLAIGVPGENDGTGAVNVLYGSSSGLSATSPRSDQYWTQASTDVNDVAETGDSFGRSLTSGDFDADGKDDLAIGVPFEDLSVDKATAGGVNVIYGSSSGLSATSHRADQFWTQDSPDINDVAEHNDDFGWSLTSGDFNGDGRDDLGIGFKWENVNSHSEAGAAQVIYGSSSGLSATAKLPDQFWTQDSANINDVAESEDQFGISISAGDFNGDGKDDLAIGVWDEDVDIGGGADVDEAGGVEVIYGSSSGLTATSPRSDQLWTQDSTDVNDVPERPDEFGKSVHSGDFNGDGKDDLAVGVWQEDVGSIESAGGVEVIYGSSSGLSPTSPRSDQFWTQDSTDVDDASEFADKFGTTLG